MDKERLVRHLMGTGKSREEAERTYNLPRDVNVLDLEEMLNKEDVIELKLSEGK